MTDAIDASPTDRTPAAGSTRRRVAMQLVYIANLVIQLTIVGLGLGFVILTDSDTSTAILLLAFWCIVGTLYSGVVMIALWLMSRREPLTSYSPSRWELGRASRIVAFSATLLASLVGVSAAIEVLALRTDSAFGGLVDVVGVWAMVLAWAYLHWGFAQIYFQQYYARTTPPLRFPQTPYPRLLEFVYFAFTMGTSFAASDVEVYSSRMRWRVLWHSVLSFFFNGLIIVLALNTILSAGKG